MANKILVYQLLPLTWGNIKTMTAFLPYLSGLNVDYIWLSPVYPSPRKNYGYDVMDYYGVDSRLGTLQDFDEFVKTAHHYRLKVIMDLIIDSTSVEHNWLRTDPNRYVWGTEEAPADWQNFYDQSPAWQRLKNHAEPYLALRHPSQADLDWFPYEVVNRDLLDAFKNIMLYWMSEHDIDGFRIGSICSLNKDLSQEKLKYNDLLTGSRAVDVVNELSNIYGGNCPFLMLDCFDPSWGEVVNFYTDRTDVEFVTSAALRSSIVSDHESTGGLKNRIRKLAENPKFMLCLESYDSARFTSRTGYSGKEAIDLMFESDAQAICLLQGQELGLTNPTEQELPIAKLFELDGRAAIQFDRHASVESIRQNSRANVRLPLPLDEYARQQQDENSILNHTKEAIFKWKC